MEVYVGLVVVMKEFILNFVVVMFCVGGVIVYLIEVVWGLGCDLLYEVVVYVVLWLKQCLIEKGMILVVVELLQLEGWVCLQVLFDVCQCVVLVSWLGVNIWILLVGLYVQFWVIGEYSGIVVCISVYLLVVVLCCVWGGLLVFISVNLVGELLVCSCVEFDLCLLCLFDGFFDGEIGGLVQLILICDVFSGNVLCF